jgi:arginine/serine-rich splicing factor 12
MHLLYSKFTPRTGRLNVNLHFRDLGMQSTSKICFIKFYDSANVSIAQHMTNTVFIDRALVVIPFMESKWFLG